MCNLSGEQVEWNGLGQGVLVPSAAKCLMGQPAQCSFWRRGLGRFHCLRLVLTESSSTPNTTLFDTELLDGHVASGQLSWRRVIGCSVAVA